MKNGKTEPKRIETKPKRRNCQIKKLIIFLIIY